MARPRKDNADYFSHDVNMRNHRKILALRQQYGLIGYAIYNMILEYIASCDHFIAKWDENEQELVAGDFGVSVAEMNHTVTTCGRLDLLQIKGGTLTCRSLSERLCDLIQKRERERSRFLSQPVAEMPQSKVKETKVKEIKVNKEINIPFTSFRDLYDHKVGDKKKAELVWNRLKSQEREEIIKTIPIFIKSISDKQFQPHPKTYLNQRRWEDEIKSFPQPLNKNSEAWVNRNGTPKEKIKYDLPQKIPERPPKEMNEEEKEEAKRKLIEFKNRFGK